MIRLIVNKKILFEKRCKAHVIIMLIPMMFVSIFRHMSRSLNLHNDMKL